jgi:glycosyltransferase involved in cell wall biosynthesis
MNAHKEGSAHIDNTMNLLASLRTAPLVSCLAVTQPGRERMLERAIGDFSRQTYAHRELTLLHDGDDAWHEVCEMLAANARIDFEAAIFVHRVAAGKTLGELRNESVRLARGHLVCQWDDDDRSHPERLQRQIETLIAANASACYLEQQLHLFADTGEWLVEDWSRQPYPRNLVQGSGLVRRDAMPTYPSQSRGEDTALLHALVQANEPIARVRGEPWLYCYSFHGDNTFDRAHHAAIARDTQVTAAAMMNVRVRLQKEVTKYVPEIGK